MPYHSGAAVGGPVTGAVAGRMGLVGPGSGLEAEAGRYLGEAGQAGIFSPFGSPRLREMLRRAAIRRAAATRRRGAISGRVLGLDPMQQRFAMTQADIGASGELSESLGRADLEQAMSARDFLQRLFMGRLDAATQERIAREQRKAAEAAARGQMIGQLGGAFIGAI